MIKVLEVFHHQAAQRITWMTAKSGSGGEWEYPSVVEEKEATGIHPIWVYIRRQQATIVEKVDCLPNYELCTEADRIPGASRMVRWWDQNAVNEPEE